MNAVEQDSAFTHPAATYPMKRRIAAELGCVASRSGLVHNVHYVANKLGYGGVGDSSKREEMLAPIIVI